MDTFDNDKLNIERISSYKKHKFSNRLYVKGFWKKSNQLIKSFRFTLYIDANLSLRKNKNCLWQFILYSSFFICNSFLEIWSILWELYYENFINGHTSSWESLLSSPRIDFWLIFFLTYVNYLPNGLRAIVFLFVDNIFPFFSRW